ncbi:MAG TPA: transglycosylase domain-containing protein [Candidatus Dormibacteraeota bacterium]|nr:transglycosylase domain-containing protein [Candidatus Dormibacteraeota bacterium]
MSKPKSSGPRHRARNVVTTKSGKSIRLNQSFGNRFKARKQSLSNAKASYLSTLPKARWKRFFYRMHPRHIAQYWFSRQGGVMGLKIVGIGIIVCFFLTIGLFAYFRKDLPNIKDLSGSNLGGSITYYDRTGNTVLWQDYDAIKRIPVNGNQISPYMKEATVAIEDKNFYKEGAFDIRGIMRAAVHDTFGGGGGLQGGSTITQQVVKLNENWTDNRTITRKVKELILAVELERQYSKSDILTGYLNIAPYGGIEYGVETAARDYFHTSAQSLTLPQAAMLAAIPQSPTYYSPYSSTRFNPAASDSFNLQALLDRQHYILDQMSKQGMITQSQADQAKTVDILSEVQPLESKYQGIRAPYFVLAAKQQLEQKYGAATVQRGGWKVITTLDLNLQNTAEQLVAQNIPSIQRYTRGVADEEATVTEDVQTGQIVALVGGTNFDNPDHGKINYAAQSLIPPGSSFKPYDYATLIDNNNNIGAGSVLYDSQTKLPGYPCTIKGLPPPKGNSNCLQDYDFLDPGPEPIRYALGGSRNIPAVKAMLEALPNDTSSGHVASINKVISTASAMMDNPYLQQQHLNTYNCYKQGVDINNASPSDITQCYGAAAIGDGAFLHLDDHVNGLATLARMGVAIPHTYILKIIDAAGKTVDQFTQPKGTQVIKPDSAYIVNNMASDPNASYLPGSCSATNCSPGGYKFHRYNGWDFAIKTGTTNDGFDGLMTSWSTKYAVVSWVGNHTRNVPLGGPGMEYLTEPLTRGMMEAAHAGLKPVNWVQPSDIKVLPAFVLHNHIHYGDVEPSPSTDLFPAWYIGGSKTNTSQTIDKVSGKVATTCTPPLAKEIQANSNVDSWNADIFDGGHNSIGTSSTNANAPVVTDDVHNCNDSPPTITLTVPKDAQGNNVCNATDNNNQGCTITATVTQGTHALSDPQYPQFPGTVTFTLNGQQINSQTVNSSPQTVTFNYIPTTTASGTLVATVTDSVLYQGTDSATVNFTAPPPPTGGTITLTVKSSSGTTAVLDWTTYNGAANYKLCWVNLTLGSNSTCNSPVDGSSNSDSIKNLIAGNKYQATVTALDSNGATLQTSNQPTWTESP